MQQWKVKLPIKIKIFSWLVLRNSTLTKDNLRRRGWKGNDHCQFCGVSETSDHLFFLDVLWLSLCGMLWHVLLACQISLGVVLFYLIGLFPVFRIEVLKILQRWSSNCHWIDCRALLQKGDGCGMLHDGTRRIRQVLQEVVNMAHG